MIFLMKKFELLNGESYDSNTHIPPAEHFGLDEEQFNIFFFESSILVSKDPANIGFLSCWQEDYVQVI